MVVLSPESGYNCTVYADGTGPRRSLCARRPFRRYPLNVIVYFLKNDYSVPIEIERQFAWYVKLIFSGHIHILTV